MVVNSLILTEFSGNQGRQLVSQITGTVPCIEQPQPCKLTTQSEFENSSAGEIYIQGLTVEKVRPF